MKYYILVLLSFFCGLINVFALEGTWEVIDIPSPSLENNILGDTTQKQIGIYLPPSYVNSDEEYPVVYFLEGYSGRVDPTGYIANILDSLISESQVPEMICVTISGAYNFRGSFYVNSPVTGNWEDFVIKDVIGFVDQNYKTSSHKDSRALTGMSMGGYGVLNLGMLHPEVFSSIYSMSPGLYDEDGIMDSQMFKDGGTMSKVFELLDILEPLSKDEAHEVYMDFVKDLKEWEWEVEFTFAYGMAFASNTDKAPYFDYPAELVGNDTVFNTDILQKWQNGFGGIELEIAKYKKNLESLKLLAVDCGYNDHYRWIVEGTNYYSTLLSKNRISHDMIWNQGTHGSLFAHQLRHKVFPMLAASLKF